MAAFAFIAERTPMQIIISVARSTVAIGIMKRCSFVALLTRDVGVRADQREARDVMIEPEFRNPTRRNMTGLATLADLTEVHVIASMAAAAGGRQSLIKVARVAVRARQVFVARRQSKARFP